MATTPVPEFELKEWTARFHTIVDRDLHASRSWKSLRKAGVDADAIVTFFALACDVPECLGLRLLEELRSHTLRGARNALRLSARLKADGEALTSYRSDLPNGLLEQMAEGATRLENAALEARKMFSRHKMNTSFFLSWLISSIQEETGSPRYRDVAILLECAYTAYGREMPVISEEALRKTHTRFMKTNPFRGLLDSEARSNLLFAAVIFVVIQALESGKIPQASALSKDSHASMRRFSLLESMQEFARKKDRASKG